MMKACNSCGCELPVLEAETHQVTFLGPVDRTEEKIVQEEVFADLCATCYGKLRKQAFETHRNPAAENWPRVFHLRHMEEE
jgi:hypothetical protein